MLKRYLARKLRKDLSPEQIAGLLQKLECYPNLCHETIYQYIYLERPNLKKCLRCKIGATVYFAYTYHSWERGANKDTNGLLRQYFPKGTAFKPVIQAKIDQAVKLINQRPRKRLNYFTPEQFFKSLKNCTLN